MLKKLVKYILGYYLLILKGAGADRLINICNMNEIKIWNITKNEDALTLCAYRKDYKRILGFAEKTETDIDIMLDKGIPFLLHKYRKRKCFLIGFLIFIFLVWKYTTFVWDINIEGEGYYSFEEIEKRIKENYVPIGSKVSGINCKWLEDALRQDYPEISWISCELKGTQLNVTLTETIRDDTISERNVPCNIVASEDCIVTEILVKNGMAVVEVGDEVKKGDILITGVVNIYNEYDELIETNYVPASGFVYGQIKRSYEDEFNMNHYIKNYTENKKTYYSFFIKENIFEPFKHENSFVNYDVITDYKKVKIFDTFYIPFAYQKTTISEYEPKLSTYTDKEAEEKAKNKLQVYINDLRKKGVEILENNVKISIRNGKCHAGGNLVTRELVGIPSDISLFEQGEDTEE